MDISHLCIDTGPLIFFLRGREPEALQVARRNPARHLVTSPVELIESDLFAALSVREPSLKADCIVSNPPYVGRNERSALQREVAV